MTRFALCSAAAVLVLAWSGGKLGNTVIMITHDVDEAVLLSDRIVMMTNGPAAGIGEVLQVGLARPCDRLAIAEQPAYVRARAAVIEFLYARHNLREAA